MNIVFARIFVINLSQTWPKRSLF